MPDWSVIHGDCREALREMETGSVQCVVTSPPFWGLRDYGIGDDQLGLEPTPELYVQHIVEIMREVRRVLRDDGTVWLNLGDNYTSTAQGTFNAPQPKGSKVHADQWAQMRPFTGLKPKDLCGIPWRVAFALQADGWWLRSDVIWSKPNPMPESVTDRPTRAHEYIFLLTKAARYFYDADAVREDCSENSHGGPNIVPGWKNEELGHADGATRLGKWTADDKLTGRNKRSVWHIATEPFPEAHFAVFPTKLVEPCVLAGSAKDSLVLDPFCGSGTVGVVALRHSRRFIGIDANPEYCEMARRRIDHDCPMFNRQFND